MLVYGIVKIKRNEEEKYSIYHKGKWLGTVSTLWLEKARRRSNPKFVFVNL